VSSLGILTSLNQSKSLRLWMIILFMMTMCHHTQKGNKNGVTPICAIATIIKTPVVQNRSCSPATIMISDRRKYLETTRSRTTTVCTRTERINRFTPPHSRPLPQKHPDLSQQLRTSGALQTAFLLLLRDLA